MQGDLVSAWAIAYAKAGWSIVPAFNKRPVVAWRQFQSVRPTIEQIENWFSTATDKTQIALVCGKLSGVSVIDIDSHKEGCASKNKGQCDCNPDSPAKLLASLPLTLTSKTGNGGFHLFFQSSAKVNNSVKLVHPQMDIRGDGGIIILPPSRHSTTGKDYEWGDLVPWNSQNLKNLADFPKEIEAKLVSKPKDKKLDWLSITKQGVREGSRNSTVASLIGKLVWKFKEEDLPALWELIWVYNQHLIKPPLEEKELARTFQSIVEAEMGRGIYAK